MSIPSWERTRLRLAALLTDRRVLLFIVAIGIVTRLKYYFEGPALWLDEAYLSLNIISRSFAELALPLDYNQAAPYGFLLVMKAVTLVAGTGEFALRLFPVFMSVAALPLYYILVRRWLLPEAQAMALALMTCADTIIWYSAQAKQYGSDVAIAIVLLILGDLGARRLYAWAAMFAVAGAAAIWFSHPSMFILAGLGLCLFAAACRQRDWPRVAALAAVGTVWTISFAINYVLIIEESKSAASYEFLLEFWGPEGFPPMPPRSAQDVEWYFEKVDDIFRHAGSIPFAGLGTVLVLLGCVHLYQRDKTRLGIALLPIAIAFVAGGLKLYPVEGRLLLFYMPLLYILLAAGVGVMFTRASRPVPALAIVTVALVLLWPSYITAKHLIRPRVISNVRPVFQYLRDNYQEGDVVYLKEWAQYNFMYYKERYNLEEIDPIVGPRFKEPWVNHLAGLDRLRGAKRAWLVLDGPANGATVQLYLPYLDQIGTRIDAFKAMNSHIYLYDLSAAPPTSPWRVPNPEPAATPPPTDTSEGGNEASGA